MIYETALDNSLWPALVVRIYHEFERLDSAPESDKDELEELKTHFARGVQISERFMQMKEYSDLQSHVLDRLAVSVELFGRDGTQIFQSGADKIGAQAMFDLPPLKNAKKELGYSAPTHQNSTDDARTVLVLGPEELADIGLPPRVGWARVRFNRDPEEIVDGLRATRALPNSRRRLLVSFLRRPDLRQAAKDINVTYETARTYMKNICEAFGVSGQTELLRSILEDPTLRFRAGQSAVGVHSVRRHVERSDGGQLEYFRVGHSSAYPIIHIDAMSGGALDVLAYPERFEPLLKHLGAQLIVPCRPGTFRSTFRKRSNAEDFAEDISLLKTALGFDRFSLLAYSHGCPAALGIANVLQDDIDRVTLASVCNPNHVAQDWRDMDFFYQVSRVIGRRWPGVLRLLLPFLCKSILQNMDNYADRTADRATCEHERWLLKDPLMRVRARAMLEDRISNGMDGMVQDYHVIAKPLGFDLKQLKVPVLAIHGDCDQVNPIAGARALVAALPNATLQEIRDFGHAFPFGEWDWLLALSAGREVQIPPPDQSGILTAARPLSFA